MTTNKADSLPKVQRFIVPSLFAVVAVATTIALLAMSKQKASPQASDEWERTYDRVSSAQVFVNGNSSPASNIYRASDRRMLVQVKYPDMEVVYVIFPDSDEVYWADGFSFREAGGKMQLIKSPPHIKPINKVLAGTTPDLIIKDDYLEFKAAKDERISAKW